MLDAACQPTRQNWSELPQYEHQSPGTCGGGSSAVVFALETSDSRSLVFDQLGGRAFFGGFFLALSPADEPLPFEVRSSVPSKRSA